MTETKKNLKKTKDFEPDLLVFCCNWCSYAGADLAGVSRFQYPPNTRGELILPLFSKLLKMERTEC